MAVKPREFLSLRENWQSEAGARGHAAEGNFNRIMAEIFQADGFEHYNLHAKPSIPGPTYGINKRLRIKPDAAIENTETGRTVFVEVKRQRARGNAHERACKFFAPGLITAGRQHGNIRKNHLPFFWVFTNGLADSEKYRSEIAFWFSSPEAENHFLLWEHQNANNKVALLDFFQNNIRPVLD